MLFVHSLHGLLGEYDTISTTQRAQENLAIFEELLDFEQNIIRLSSSTTVSFTTNFAANPLYHNSWSRPNHVSHLGNNSNHMDRPATNNFCEPVPKIIGNHSLINGTRLDGHIRNNAQSQTQKAHANYATQNTRNDGNRPVHFGALHHILQDLKKLSLHSDYDGSEDFMLDDDNE
ncbi:hypothetical protein RDI58_013302 [Solanum bulbocastanum]|uniref:Uncharacterized protein n=1 Tax=Solanum bulbocastanum TaxID=147425 RepID=A0AAN8TQL9_SOLBU